MRRTIGQFAKETGTGKETVRFYERLGLLRQPPRLGGGWREYGVRHLHTIDYIKAAQKMGFTLAQIKALVDRLDDPPTFCTGVRAAAAQRLKGVDEELRELLATRRKIN